jgi:hypothetical protein
MTSKYSGKNRSLTREIPESSRSVIRRRDQPLTVWAERRVPHGITVAFKDGGSQGLPRNVPKTSGIVV